jgi:hypothetical protein
MSILLLKNALGKNARDTRMHLTMHLTMTLQRDILLDVTGGGKE